MAKGEMYRGWKRLENRVKDGPACRGCGLPNYQGFCPHCRGDQDAYERELVPPFPSTREGR